MSDELGIGWGRCVRRMGVALLLLPAMVTVLLVVRPAAAATSTLLSIGSLGTSMAYYNSRGNALNEAGVVAATAFTQRSGTGPLFVDARAARFDSASGSPVLSPLVPYVPGTAGSVTHTHPRDINASGTVVGFASNTAWGAPGAQDRGFVFQGGTMTTLPTLVAGAATRANAVNDAGVIVGQSGTQAFRYQAGAMSAISGSGMGSSSAATGINASGAVVGWTADSGGPTRPFLFDAGGVSVLPLPAGAAQAYAVDVNDAGSVLVAADFNSGGTWSTRGYVYSDGAYAALPVLPGTLTYVPQAINAWGQVVGQSFVTGWVRRATLNTAGIAIDLNTLLPAGTGFSLFDAADINGNGIITGTGLYQSKETGYVLTPAAGDANMNGRIDADDFAMIDRGSRLGLGGRINGDFNMDGVIDSSDYLLIDTAWERQIGALSPELLVGRGAAFGEAYVRALVAAVPEPGLAMGVISPLLLLRRPRRSRAHG